uniref:Zinc finger protein 638-like n=1 Tax=Stegastes partitus TaxID=144197 RepID=A0A3B5BE80_9TELE
MLCRLLQPRGAVITAHLMDCDPGFQSGQEMQKINKKKRTPRTKAAHHLTVHTDSSSHRAATLSSEPRAELSIASSTRGNRFVFGPVASAAAATTLLLAQIESQSRIALQQLATLATIAVGSSGFAAALPPHLALLSLLNRQQVSAVGFNTNSKTYRTTRTRLSAAMYHQHSQQQGSQPFPNGPRPPLHQPPPNQHQNHANMQVMSFPFPRPTQLPDELESALAIRGARDMDHRQMDHLNRPNLHQNQGSSSGISQHGSYGSNTVSLPADSQPGHQQGVDWSSYQPPTKLFAGPAPNASHQGQQQPPQGSQVGARVPTWTPPVSDSLSPQARHPQGGGGDGQGLYTPESAGSILASFGLSNEDLEVLSHYPDDQLTPDTLPFILRDIQINKSGNQKTVASVSSSSFPRGVRDIPPLPAAHSAPLAHPGSTEVPSLLTVTQTAGKVIDYGHASRAKDESGTRETFKREPLSSERTVKMYAVASAAPSSAPKPDKSERRQVHLEHTESSKHGDRDYRRTSGDQRKSSRSPGREFPSSPTSRNLDRDYRRDRSKLRPSSEARSEASSRRSLSSSSGSKPHNSSKKLPTPTMISDFSAVSPKVYPHTCSLCHTQCDQEKDWVDHVNTVNHTAACRDLRNKYPSWKPNLPSRSGRYGSRALWNPKDRSSLHSTSRSLSRSPTPSPPGGKHRVDAHPHRPHGRPYSPHSHPRHRHYTERGRRFEPRPSGSHSPTYPNRASPSSREQWPERTDREPSGGFARGCVKRPRVDLAKRPADGKRRQLPSAPGHRVKHGPPQLSNKSFKGVMKPGAKTAKMSAKPPPAKKKKKVVTPASQDSSIADRLVYLTGIPKDASEQEVTDLVGSFGKINNVILMPCSEEETEKGQGQKASVCMVKAEDAQALATSTNLHIREQELTASVAKKLEAGPSSEANNSRPVVGQDKGAAGNNADVPTGSLQPVEAEADQKTSEEKGLVLITGLPESGWSDGDVVELLQPFGTPSDIVMATQIGKVLVSVPNMEVAQEIIKVHTFMPAKINGSELKMVLLKQHVGLSTPVALYNLLMGSVDPLESPAPVGWSSLLVISNVPNTPPGSSEVQKLVQRFGTVIKTLVLNNMVICQMATAAMALSVYKRFQTFPCIIQSNPLFFSRKPDPKASTQAKVIAAYIDSSEDTPAHGKASEAAADDGETAPREKSEPPLEEMDQEGDRKDEKTSTQETAEDDVLGENGSKDDVLKKMEPTVSESLAAPNIDPEADVAADTREPPAVESVTETVEEKEGVGAVEVGNEETGAGDETKPFDSKAASQEAAMPELPKVTQAMVNALLVECRTKTVGHPNNTAAPPSGGKEAAQVKTNQSEATKEPATDQPPSVDEEEGLKKQEKERKEREAKKEKETKERERRERRVKEKEDRARQRTEWLEKVRRDGKQWDRKEWARKESERKERKERERKEWERKERERRERKRGYGESLSGSRSSFRSEGSKQQRYNEETDARMVEEEECDEFPFNMSDFVTLDEVGDVTDLPRSPSAVAMETSEGPEDASTSVQQDISGDAPVEATVTPAQSDEPVSDSGQVSAPTAEASDGLPNIPPGLVLDAVVPPPAVSPRDPRQTPVPTCPPEEPEADTTHGPDDPLAATPDCTPKAEALPTPAPAAPAGSSSDSPAAGVAAAGRLEDEKEDDPLNPEQAKEEEEEAVNRQEEQGELHDKENKETRAAETGERCEDHGDSKEDSGKTTVKTETPMKSDQSLPPYDSSNPVGMEFLVPKTGFFCKVCSRFFSGTKEAEINHCKSLKHYKSLQAYLQSTNTASPAGT